jgi:ABC-2 type transport system permease protein
VNTATTPVPESPNQSHSATRPFYWSVWRELWENKSIYIAPLIVGCVILFGMLVSAGHLPQRRRNAMLLDEAHRRAAIHMPYNIVAIMIILTAFIVGLFYCLDALHGERRDRSILFWKSLPVSDATTVLSKACIALIVLPLIAFVITVVLQFMMMLVSSLALMSSGLSGTTWANYNWLTQALILIYSLIALSLWHAPIYGWALLVSVWARRATFLAAVLPWLAVAMFEKITFGTNYVGSFVQYRLMGFAPMAFDFRGQKSPCIESLAQLTPGNYLTSLGLWLGLICAAGFLAGAIRLRRYRGPL